MGNLTLNGATSGQITISPPAVAGSNTITLPAATGTIGLVTVISNPTQTIYTSGSGTYTVPTGVKWLRVRMVGGGGGGSGGGTSGGTGGTGGTTTLGSSFLTCVGGTGGAEDAGSGGAGGTATVILTLLVKQVLVILHLALPITHKQVFPAAHLCLDWGAKETITPVEVQVLDMVQAVPPHIGQRVTSHCPAVLVVI